MDPYTMVCPTFGCRGDCYVCDPERKMDSKTTESTEEHESLQSVNISERLKHEEVIEVKAADVESSVKWGSGDQKKKSRFLKKSFWLRIFGLTAVTTAFMALQSYSRAVIDKVSF